MWYFRRLIGWWLGIRIRNGIIMMRIFVVKRNRVLNGWVNWVRVGKAAVRPGVRACRGLVCRVA